MKWCRRCGQQLKPVLPGKTCTQCGWVRPLTRSRRIAKHEDQNMPHTSITEIGPTAGNGMETE